MTAQASFPPPAAMTEAGLGALIALLGEGGRRVIGPVERDGAIVPDEIGGIGDLPRGVRVTTAPGRYRLERSGGALFDHAVAAFPWKRFLHPPRETLSRTRRTEEGLAVEPAPMAEPPMAFLGVRACDLAALASLDSVLLDGAFPDARYAARRRAATVVAVNCRTAADTCFCASLGTGPRAGAGADLILTEIGEGLRFLVEAGSDAGAALLERLPTEPAAPRDVAAAEAGIDRARSAQSRAIETEGLPEALAAAAESPHWEAVAARCLTCANCTMVCPTCFCSATEEESDFAGTDSARTRRWDSCFTLDFSHVHGGPVRPSPAARYRQWLTHKLGTWPAQFGTAGCVGCGRCIAWCPVGIDITEEVATIRRTAP